MNNATGNNEILQLVTFKLGKEEYAVDILKIQEVNRIAEITAMPHADPALEGVINLRGKVIPVVNLRRKFGMETNGANGQSRIMVIDAGKTVGLIVDSVSQVLRLHAGDVEAPPQMSRGGRIDYVKGVGKLDNRLVMLLDVDKLLDVQDA